MSAIPTPDVVLKLVESEKNESFESLPPKEKLKKLASIAQNLVNLNCEVAKFGSRCELDKPNLSTKKNKTIQELMQIMNLKEEVKLNSRNMLFKIKDIKENSRLILIEEKKNKRNIKKNLKR